MPNLDDMLPERSEGPQNAFGAQPDPTPARAPEIAPSRVRSLLAALPRPDEEVRLELGPNARVAIITIGDRRTVVPLDQGGLTVEDWMLLANAKDLARTFLAKVDAEAVNTPEAEVESPDNTELQTTLDIETGVLVPEGWVRAQRGFYKNETLDARIFGGNGGWTWMLVDGTAGEAVTLRDAIEAAERGRP